jgi:pyruvate formate lyase activating enzyme
MQGLRGTGKVLIRNASGLCGLPSLGKGCPHTALCGVSNERTKENFEYVAQWFQKRPEPPPLIASTLLVPGYIDEEEVRNISKWIASLNPEIPYALLAFYPQFFFEDLPPTSKGFAFRCKEVAEMEGLRRVRIGNTHLL